MPTQVPAVAEPFRPRFHFTPRRNWCNDPNGLVWFDGEYHLFYQYNPFGDIWGHMSWGHAISTDLLHWTELGVAIPEDAHNMIFSGSAVCDEHNTSAFGGEGNAPVLVAIYTGHHEGQAPRQTQNLAYSIDRGRSWTKYQANPVLDIGLRHFRDPKVFWHAPTARWVMIVALSDRNKISLYASPDLKSWSHLSDFGPAGAGGTLWECPDLFALPVAGTTTEKWILKVDMFEGGVAGAASAQYFIGSFDGTEFIPDKTAIGADLWRWADYGMDFYAAVTWSNLPPHPPRCLWIGWMSAHLYAADLPTAPWRGAMTLPRELCLEARPQGLTLVQHPARELAQLRGPAITVPARTVRNETGLLAALADCSGGIEAAGTLSCLDAAECGFFLAWSSGDAFRFGYNGAGKSLFIDRSNAGQMSQDPRFTGRRHAHCAATRVTFHLYVDACSIEIFADDGAIVFTELLFPSGDLKTISFYATAGTATAGELTLWPLVA